MRARSQRFGGSGMNFDTRCWYSRYASPRLRNDCASVGGMPVTPKIDPKMMSCGTIATSPHGANATPYTAYPSHTHHSKK